LNGERRSLSGWIKEIFREASNWKELSRTPYGLKPVLILASISFFQLFDNAVFGASLPNIVQDLDLDIASISTIVSIVGTFAVFASLMVGWLADRHRRLPLVGIGSIFSGVFSILSSRASTLFTLGLPRVLDEMSGIGAGIPRFSLLADYYPPEVRGKVFAILGTLARSAALLAPLAIGGMIAAWGWRPVTALFGAPMIVLGALALLLLREPVRGYMERRSLGLNEEVSRVEDEPRSFGEGIRTIFSIRTLRRLFLANIFADAGVAIFQLYVVFMLADVYGLDALERGIILIPTALAGLLAGFLGGGLVDTFSGRNPGRVLIVFGVMWVIGSVGLAVVATQPPLAILIIGVGVFAFGTALVGPATLAVFAQVLPANVRTQGTQVINLGQLPGFLFVLPAASILNAEWGFSAALFFAVPFVLVGAVIAATASQFFDLDMRSAFAAAAADEEWRRAKAEGRGKLLVCRSVDVSYDGVQVVFDVDFDVEEGEIVALLGTNGAGKSSLLKAISGTQEASGGAVVFDGRDITHMPPHEVAARGVVHMPGGRGVFPDLTVRENLVLGRWLTDDDPEAASRLAEVFEIFPILRERASELAGALSGGEQQQLSLAQTFLAKPKLLMIDELSMGLSPAMIDRLLDVVREINRRGVTIIVVEQSVNVALRVAKRAVFMEKGEVRFFGDTRDLVQRPDLMRAVYVRGTQLAAPESALQSAERVRRADELDRAPTILEVADVTKSFGGIVAVDHVSFELREGEVVGLIGPNGAGKTTLLDLISGYQTPDEGTIRMEGVDVANQSPEARAERRLIRRFQDARLFPSLTVLEAILVALDQQHQARHPALTLVQAPRARRAERRLRVRATRLLEVLSLESYSDKMVGELSTGLRRIADLACVLASQPRVLLLDEPSTGIASSEVDSLAPLLLRVRAETGCSIIIVEHSMSLIGEISDRLIALDQGRVIATGPPEEVLSNETVVDSYLGSVEQKVKA
jgi:ABC-type branched-subunit amino acid transport system ATPase component/MFS family permease